MPYIATKNERITRGDKVYNLVIGEVFESDDQDTIDSLVEQQLIEEGVPALVVEEPVVEEAPAVEEVTNGSQAE